MGWLKFVFSLPGSILISSFISSYSHAGTILITEQEANLPQESVLVAGRAITRGPSVQFVQSGATVHSPIHFQVRFQAFGGSKINLDTLRMIYLKTPEKFRVLPSAITSGGKPNKAAYKVASMLGQHVGHETLRRRAQLLQSAAGRIYRDRIGVDLFRPEGRCRALVCGCKTQFRKGFSRGGMSLAE